MIRWIRLFSFGLGVQPRSPLSEQLTATIGGITSLLLITSLSIWILGAEASLAVVPSMGAATVLLFAAPHGPLSQPWALLVGNLISAFIGVVCATWVSNIAIAAGLAVGLSIGGMHLLRCIHPPGGATALAAVLGGEAIQELGFGYMLYPVFLNCVIILFVALLFNNLFGWRRYPIALMRYTLQSKPQPSPIHLTRDEIVEGMKKFGGVLDVTPEQLLRIYSAAQQAHEETLSSPLEYELGGIYTNNQPGAEWGIREIIDFGKHPDPEQELIVYKTLEGAHKGSIDSCSKREFTRWANNRLKERA